MIGYRPLLFVTFALLLCASAAPHAAASDPFARLHWRSIGPAVSGGRLGAVAGTDRDAALYYAGAADGGVWKTTSGGAAWEPVFDREDVQSIGAIAIDPQNESTVWVGTGESNPRNDVTQGDGIYKTTDGAKHWTRMLSLRNSLVSRISIDRKQSEHVVVAVLGDPFADSVDRGIYRHDRRRDDMEEERSIFRRAAAPQISSPIRRIRRYSSRECGSFAGPAGVFRAAVADDGLFRSTDGGADVDGHAGRRVAGWTDGPHRSCDRAVGSAAYLRVDTNRARIALAFGRRRRALEDGLRESADGRTPILFQQDFRRSGQRRPYLRRIRAHDALDRRRKDVRDRGPRYARRSSRDVDRGGRAAHRRRQRRRCRALARRRRNVGLGESTADLAVLSHRTLAPTAISRLRRSARQRHLVRAFESARPARGERERLAYHGLWRRHVGDRRTRRTHRSSGSRLPAAISAATFKCTTSASGTTHDVSPYLRDQNVVDPKDLRYRFNWETPIAFDPFDSRYGLRRRKRTLRNARRRRRIGARAAPISRATIHRIKLISGGITKDGTGAETSDTILSIAPSSAARGEIWVGTDDGFVQLTRDGGATWTNVTPQDAGAWGRFASIAPSRTNPAVAYAIEDRHMVGDRSAYVFATHDYGRHWR